MKLHELLIENQDKNKLIKAVQDGVAQSKIQGKISRIELADDFVRVRFTFVYWFINGSFANDSDVLGGYAEFKAGKPNLFAGKTSRCIKKLFIFPVDKIGSTSKSDAILKLEPDVSPKPRISGRKMESFEYATLMSRIEDLDGMVAVKINSTCFS